MTDRLDYRARRFLRQRVLPVLPWALAVNITLLVAACLAGSAVAGPLGWSLVAVATLAFAVVKW